MSEIEILKLDTEKSIGKWTAEFLSKDLESSYLLENFRRDQKLTVIAAVILSILWFLCILLDALTILPISTSGFILLSIDRVITSAVCLFIAWRISRADSYKVLKWYYPFVILFLCVSYSWVVIQYVNLLGHSMSNILYVALTFAVLLLTPLPLRTTIIGSLIVFISAVVTKIFFLSPSLSEIYVFITTMIIVIIFSTTIANYCHKLWRGQYWDRLQLEEANQELKNEIALRRSGEAKLKRYQNELETLVDERTQQLRDTERNLQSTQRLESVGLLAGGIAHDFNNSLGIVVGLVDLCRDDENLNDELKERLRMMKVSVTRASELVKQLLAFSRRQIVEFREVNINKLIENDNLLISQVAPENVSLHIDLTSDINPILGDPGQLEQVIMNLVLNARDSMPSGGVLVIETFNEWLNEKKLKKLSGGQIGNYVCVSVADTGSGMSHDTQERIFEPFFTTKAEGKGTGLGLSVVIGIVQQHGGFVDISSRLDEGTSITVYIPVKDNRALGGKVGNGSGPSIKNARSGLILLVDDDASVLEITTKVLHKWGYQVLKASDGLQALYFYQQLHEEIALVLIDIVMPNMGGRELLNSIREISNEQKVLFTTGHSSDSIHATFLAEEKLPILEKPYTNNSLLIAVRTALGNESESAS